MKCTPTLFSALSGAKPGDRLKWFRQQQHLSQEAFGFPLEIAQSQVSRYESGYLSLSVEMAQRVANHYQVDLLWLLTGNGQP